jgi:hypothetical protein
MSRESEKQQDEKLAAGAGRQPVAPAVTTGTPTSQAERMPQAGTPAAAKADAKLKQQAEEEGEPDKEALAREAHIRERGAKELDADKPVVNINVDDFAEKHPYQPMGPGNWAFRFGEDEDAEVRIYADEFSAAKARAAEEAREAGVDTLYLLRSSSIH